MALKKFIIKIVPIITFVIGILLGPGSLWKHKEVELQKEQIGIAKNGLKISKEQVTINKLIAEIEKQRLENVTLQVQLNSAVETTKLRGELNNLFLKIIELSNAFIPLDLCSNSNPTINNKANQLRGQLVIVKNDFKILEDKLSKIEHRQPREINLDFIRPCPPKLLKIE
jgi:hypothetical protein